MNREKIVKIALSFTCLIIIITFIFVFSVNKHQEKLILKEYNGHIALFKGEKIEKEYTDADISLFPAYDRKLLKEGIVIENDTQLRILLEDYDI